MPDPAARLNAALERRYRIERELGVGGMATVYLADDLRHERKVAVKVLKPELTAIVGAERFLAEIKTTANLQHPHILPLFDSGEADGLLWYAMPFVPGESLRGVLDRERQLPVDEAVRIAVAVAESLDHAHRHGVIHRDIKPANILMLDGNPLVTDFGIALAVGAAGGGRLTETGLSLGTPYYMSPEQATADREPAPQSDIYSLGCVLYEMLVGDPPYAASTAQAVLAKILTGDIPVPSESRSSIPPHVDAAIRRALEKLPADRFRDARELARALGDPTFRHGKGETDPTREGAVAGAPPRRLVTAMAAAIVLLAAALGWTLIRMRGSDGARSAVTRFDLTPGVGEPGVRDGGVSLDISEDGRRIVFAADPNGDGTRLWIRALDDLHPEPIPGTEGAGSPVFSPDGRTLAFVREGLIHTMTLPDGPPLSMGDGEFPAWGDDGALYYASDLIIYRVPPGGGTPQPFTESVGIDQIVPDPLPGGKGMLLTIRRSTQGYSRIAVAGPQGGTPRETLDGTQARYLRSGHVLYTSSDGTMLAAPFDLEALEAGPGIPVVSRVRVSGNSATQFAVSASGSLVYVTATGGSSEREWIWVDRTGAIELIDGSQDLGGSFPALSPDGSRVAVLSGGGVWVKPLSGGPAVRINIGTDDTGGPVHPAWSPAGDSLLVNPRENLLSAPADGGGQPVVIHTNPRGIVAPNWSPRGDWIVYRTSINLEGTGDIMAFRPGRDSVAVPLVATELPETGPAISPDGRWLAYTVGGVAGGDVYVSPFPNVDDGRRLVGEGANPIWARDGSELYYVKPDTLVAVQVRTDPTFQVLSSQVLWTSDATPIGPSLDAGYDVAPDGRFLKNRRVGEERPEVHVILIQNLFTLLEELAGGSGGA